MSLALSAEERAEIIRLIEEYGSGSGSRGGAGAGAMNRRSAFYRLNAVADASVIHFRHAVAVGGGGIHEISKTGITSLTDAGAAGLGFAYDSPSNRWLIINAATNSYFGYFGASDYLQYAVGGGERMLVSGTQFVLDYGIAQSHIFDTYGGRMTGWLLAKGVHSYDNHDTPPIAETVGAGGQIAWMAGRGGIKQIQSVLAAAPSYEDNGGYEWISLQDAPRMYSRWTAMQYDAGTPNAYMSVGWRDAANTNEVSVQWDAAVAGGNITIRANRAGATTIHDTGVAAVQGQYHVCELISTTAGVVTVYIDGTLVHTLAAAECPVTTTLMEERKYAAPVAPAILAELRYDVVRTVLSRNTGVTP